MALQILTLGGVMTFEKTAQKSVNTIRMLAADMIQKANSGHPGLPLGAAPMAYVLWKNHLRVAPNDARWINRDRFVLSAGHGSALLYAMLFLSGFRGLTLDDLKNFRQLGSKTPGHPEFGMTPGVDATTGPLGQGIANAVGMAIAEKMLSARFGKIIDHFTYVLAGDGCLMEGISSEAASLAGHLKLGKLIVLYDSNDVSLDGPTNITFTEDIQKRFESYGFHVQTVQNGDTDLDAIDKALTNAKNETGKPSLIIVKTTIGYGSPNKAGKSSSHGSPLGADEIYQIKQAFGMDPERTFAVDDDVLEDFAKSMNRNIRLARKWKKELGEVLAKDSGKAELFKELFEQGSKDLDEKIVAILPKFTNEKKIATRTANGEIVSKLASVFPWIIGGDADLSCSTKTAIKGKAWISADDFSGSNIHFGVREHAMGAVINGICYHGGFRPFSSTFFSFVDYMRPPIRLAALAGLDPVFIFTHDSLAVGEDGPTHQPVEQLASLRCIPRLNVMRPADANETAEAWRYILTHKDQPTVLVLTRQDLPVIDRTKYESAEGVLRGGYAILKNDKPDILLIATGSEVHLALEAAKLLISEGKKVQVVNIVSREIFEKQPKAYRRSVIPPAVKRRVVIEAASSFGWEKYSGISGKIISADDFGTSAPGETVLQKYGFTVENIVKTAKSMK